MAVYALVTGAGSGIGRATAVRLAAAGTTVVCIDIDEAAARGCVDEIAADGGSAHPLTVDVRDRAQVDRAVEQAVELGGRLDMVANVAGAVTGRGDVVDLSDTAFDDGLRLNLTSQVYVCRAAGRVMAEQGGGAIVNVSSGTVDGAAPGIGAYSIAKAGVLQLTRTLAMELGPHGVRVNTVSPGYVETAMTAVHYRDADDQIDEDARAAVARRQSRSIALGRPGAPAEVAEVIAFLASDAASYVTGQIVRVNGGLVMPL